jgi:hypothetical protein
MICALLNAQSAVIKHNKGRPGTDLALVVMDDPHFLAADLETVGAMMASFRTPRTIRRMKRYRTVSDS